MRPMFPFRAFVVALAALLLVVFKALPAHAQDGDEAELAVTSVTRDESTGAVTIEAIAPFELTGGALEDDAISVAIGNEFQEFDYSTVSTDTLQVVLVIDVSNSMRGRQIAAAKEAAVSFIDRLPEAVDVSIVVFDDAPALIAEMGTPRSELAGAISGLDVGGSTALYDALLLAGEQFDGAEQRVVLALTDGEDSASTATAQVAGKQLVLDGIEVHGVGLATDESTTDGLEAIVRDTNGTFTRAASADSLLNLYNQLAARLASRFTVTFTPPTADAGRALLVFSQDGVVASARAEFTSSDGVKNVPNGTTTPADDATTSPAPAGPAAFTLDDGSWIESTTARNVGFVTFAVFLLVIGLILSFPSERVGQLASKSKDRAAAVRVTDLTGKLEGMADRRLNNNGRRRRLTKALERGGIDLRPAEFVVIAGSIALTSAAVFSLFGGVLAAAIAFGVTIVLIRFGVARRGKKRTEAFLDQLPGTLNLIAGALRAGYALPQAVETVAAETEAPTCDEFHRLVTEHRLGRDFGEALHAMGERIGAEDFNWVVQALDIHRDVGGDLAEVLDNVNRTMRDRAFIRRQFAAVSAEGRYSAYLIVSLPFIVTAALFVTNPAYISKLFDGFRGFAAITLAVVLVAVGSYWMKVLMKVRF